MSQLTIEEIQKKKRALQINITALLDMFEKETTLTIEKVNVIRELAPTMEDMEASYIDHVSIISKL